MSRVTFLPASVVGVALVSALAACGSDSAPPPVRSSNAAPSTASTNSSALTKSTAPLDSTPPISSAASSVGPAPAGSVITSDASKNLPTAVGGFEKQPASGPATIYENAAGDQIGVSFLLNSKYETIVTALTDSVTTAGTGKCGTDGEPTNSTCYLKAADGVYNVSGDGVDVLVTFSNQLAAALGTS